MPAHEWYYLAGGQPQGPLTGAELRDLLASDLITATTEVWRHGMESWLPAADVAELADALPADAAAAETCTLTAGEWWFAQADKKYGPVSAERLTELVREGRLSASDLVWREGLTQWLPAEQVEGLCARKASAPPPLPVAPPAHAGGSGSAGGSASAAVPRDVLTHDGWMRFDADRAGDYEGMLRYMNTALARNGEHHLFYHCRALALGELHDPDQAIEDLNRALEMKPDWASGYYLRALQYYRIGEGSHGRHRADSLHYARMDIDEALWLEPHNANFVRFQNLLYRREEALPAAGASPPPQQPAASAGQEGAGAVAARTAGKLLGKVLWSFFDSKS
jgi:tetratricopeptide (TPR) repeat protein